MRALCALFVLMLTGSAFAQAPAAAPADPFIGSVSLGYLATTGNTESKNANASMKATWDLDGPWKHDWSALAISAPSRPTSWPRAGSGSSPKPRPSPTLRQPSRARGSWPGLTGPCSSLDPFICSPI